LPAGGFAARRQRNLQNFSPPIGIFLNSKYRIPKFGTKNKFFEK